MIDYLIQYFCVKTFSDSLGISISGESSFTENSGTTNKIELKLNVLHKRFP